MRRFVLTWILVVGLSSQAGQILAATIETYARVNIVPGAEALLTTEPRTEDSKFTLSGSAMQNVSFQVTNADAATVVFNSGHETFGTLEFEFTPARANDDAPPSSDGTITVIFE